MGKEARRAKKARARCAEEGETGAVLALRRLLCLMRIDVLRVLHRLGAMDQYGRIASR